MPVYYGSNVADATLTTACDMASATGGSETHYDIAITGSNAYAEIPSKGGTSASVAALPAPTGKGWVFKPGAGSFALGNWSAICAMSEYSNGNYSFTSLRIRFYRLPSGVLGSAVSIGSIVATSPSWTGTTKKNFSFGNTSMGAVTTGADDLIYVDLWYSDSGISGDYPTIYESTSATAGLANDVQVTTTAFTPSAATFTRSISGISAAIQALGVERAISSVSMASKALGLERPTTSISSALKALGLARAITGVSSATKALGVERTLSGLSIAAQSVGIERALSGVSASLLFTGSRPISSVRSAMQAVGLERSISGVSSAVQALGLELAMSGVSASLTPSLVTFERPSSSISSALQAVGIERTLTGISSAVQSLGVERSLGSISSAISALGIERTLSGVSASFPTVVEKSLTDISGALSALGVERTLSSVSGALSAFGIERALLSLSASLQLPALTLELAYYGTSASEPIGASLASGWRYSRDDTQSGSDAVPIPASTGQNFSWYKQFALTAPDTGYALSNYTIRHTTEPPSGIRIYWKAASSYVQASAENKPDDITGINDSAPPGYTLLTTTPQQWYTGPVEVSSAGRQGDFLLLVLGVGDDYVGDVGDILLNTVTWTCEKG